MDRDRIIDALRGETITVDAVEYKLVKELGRGGNGVAFLCQSKGTSDVVAKVYIPPDARDLDDQALARFNAEIAITTKIKHAHVVPALGSSSMSVGAYVLPFYLMPVAADTLRKLVTAEVDPDAIERKLRLFLRAGFGVACLHNHLIVHRDLKPENILINRAGDPWVADLGIAHVNPGFVSVGLKTIASERLLNRDYYAPEQRYGEKVEVDHRADIYALGCIFYELLTSIPPIRANVPDLALLSKPLAPFDPIWKRMTEWKAEQRYQTIEQALEDVAFAMGTVLATLRGTAGFRNPDLATMLKDIRSNNEVHRRKGIATATRLGKAALADLHGLLGHSRRDIRNSAATALGQILDPSSVPLLVAAMYGNSDKPSQFKPASETAAEALSHFSLDERLRALRDVERPVLLVHALTILKGVDATEAYDVVVRLAERKLLALDWGETELQGLVVIDEDRAWPGVQEFVASSDGIRLRRLISLLSRKRKLIAIRAWIEKGTDYKWFVDQQLELIDEAKFSSPERSKLLTQLQEHVAGQHWKYEDKAALQKKISTALAKK